MVLKATYQRVIDKSLAGATVGFVSRRRRIFLLMPGQIARWSARLNGTLRSTGVSVNMTHGFDTRLPAAAIVSVASPAHAVQYLSIEEAQRQAFPSATNFTEVQAGRVWKAEAGGRVAGFFIFDRVIGKHLYIDYAVALTPSGRVHAVDILQYRESYGGEIRSPSWLAQFVGKTSGSPLQDQRRHPQYLRRDVVVART